MEVTIPKTSRWQHIVEVDSSSSFPIYFLQAKTVLSEIVKAHQTDAQFTIASANNWKDQASLERTRGSLRPKGVAVVCCWRKWLKPQPGSNDLGQKEEAYAVTGF